MELFAMVAAALPLAGGPLAAALLVVRRRPALRTARAARTPSRLAEELRAVAEVLPRVRPVLLTPPKRATVEPGPALGPCRSCHAAAVPRPRRPPAPDELTAEPTAASPAPACAACTP
ncbi:hypothetical protein QRX50_40265 [Amycolatopsis carbonis]|uniref:Uncharacterized protein n=1 Tax=Amycolatopsis carbonis TaxID=715471 RepID=A0A9Y2IED2_9PSEU|nr:hypothetical protein [Amycolatopsis sp. 2-15]WIX77580.1 hypothetical protein QRX50_40265 [Amycolatopsis sp. 2-15]